MALSAFIREQEALKAERRRNPQPVVYDATAGASEKQAFALASTGRYLAWPAGRRSGKTDNGQRWMLREVTAHERVSVVYLNTTIARAVDTVWDELKAANEAARLRGVSTESPHKLIRFPNRSRLHVKGGETRKHIDRVRGMKKIRAVVIDEAQDWDNDLLKYAIGSVILPALADVQGRLLVMGSGGDPGSYWHEIVTKAPDLGFSRGPSPWTLHDNPIIADAEAEIAATCRLRGVGPDDASIRREYYADFVKNQALQILSAGPQNYVKRSALPTGKVHKVIAADFGTVDACACVVFGWVESRPDIYVLEVVKESGLGASEQTRFVRSVIDRHREGLWGVCGDGGGLGKALVMDLKRTSQLYEVEPAEKANKVPALRLLAGDLRNGTVKIPEDEKTFIADLARPEWHPDHVGERVKGHMPDAVDAALYGYRKVKTLFTYTPPEVKRRPTMSEKEKAEDAAERAQAAHNANAKWYQQKAWR